MFTFAGFIGKMIEFLLARVAEKRIDLALDEKKTAARAFVRFHESVAQLERILDEFLEYSETFVQGRNCNVRASRISRIVGKLNPASKKFVTSLEQLGPALALYDPALARSLGRVAFLQNVYYFLAQSVEAMAGEFEVPYPIGTPPKASFQYTPVEEYFCTLNLTIPSDTIMEADWSEWFDRVLQDVHKQDMAKWDLTEQSERNSYLINIIQSNIENIHINYSDISTLTHLNHKLKQHRQVLVDALEGLRNFIESHFSIVHIGKCSSDSAPRYHGTQVTQMSDTTDFPDSSMLLSADELLLLVSGLQRQVDFYAQVSYGLANVCSHDFSVLMRSARSNVLLFANARSCEVFSDDDRREMLNWVIEACDRSEQMAKALSHYHRVLSRPPTARGDALTDANAVLHSVITYDRQIGKLLADTAGEISHATLPRVAVDEHSLATVFEQLIANALTFHRDGVQPLVHVHAQEDEQEWIMAVTDNGTGVEEQYGSVVFRPFTTLVERNRGRTGMGLAICKAIVTLRGGRIWYKSVVGKGATFYFALPKVA